MATPAPKILKKPSKPGFMGPLAILKAYAALKDLTSEAEADAVMRAAQVHRLPFDDEPIREAKVASVHQKLRAARPDIAEVVLTTAGRLTADHVMTHRMSRRAQAMLIGAPWTVSAWLLGQSVSQNAWTFAGSGRFEIVNRMEFCLHDNPVIRGETADAPICVYHQALLTRMFQSLVHEDLQCTEVCCGAHQQGPCRFVLHAPREGV